LDRWILDEFSALEQAVFRAYDDYEFHVVYQKVSQFVAVELSAIYHDVVKDRLYTDAASSGRRRSTQTTLLRLCVDLCKMLAPMLAFTADEAWAFVPGKKAGSAHELIWEPMSFERSTTEREAWGSLFKLRELALPALEKARQAKQIGKALEAKLTFSGSAEALAQARGSSEALRELLNVSQLDFMQTGESAISVSVSRAAGEKCERCWHWETDIGSHPDHPTICTRCVKAITNIG
jgi:isoleucyl-tRNA synthetase